MANDTTDCCSACTVKDLSLPSTGAKTEGLTSKHKFGIDVKYTKCISPFLPHSLVHHVIERSDRDVSAEACEQRCFIIMCSCIGANNLLVCWASHLHVLPCRQRDPLYSLRVSSSRISLPSHFLHPTQQNALSDRNSSINLTSHCLLPASRPGLVSEQSPRPIAKQSRVSET